MLRERKDRRNDSRGRKRLERKRRRGKYVLEAKTKNFKRKQVVLCAQCQRLRDLRKDLECDN